LVDQARVQRYLDVEKALSLVEGRLGVIPSEAAEEIGRHCNVSEMDFERMKSAMEHIGYPLVDQGDAYVAHAKEQPQAGLPVSEGDYGFRGCERRQGVHGRRGRPSAVD
jgi:adenylosuccinate lyase